MIRKRLHKLGNSVGMIFDREILTALGAKLGDEMNVTIRGGSIWVRKARRKNKGST